MTYTSHTTTNYDDALTVISKSKGTWDNLKNYKHCIMKGRLIVCSKQSK